MILIATALLRRLMCSAYAIRAERVVVRVREIGQFPSANSDRAGPLCGTEPSDAAVICSLNGSAAPPQPSGVLEPFHRIEAMTERRRPGDEGMGESQAERRGGSLHDLLPARALRVAHVERANALDRGLHRFLLRFDQLRHRRRQHPVERVVVGVERYVLAALGLGHDGVIGVAWNVRLEVDPAPVQRTGTRAVPIRGSAEATEVR